MSELYDRQQSLGLQAPKSVAVVGCGGVGSWLALTLALAGVPELWLFDHDTVSEHNLNRLPMTAEAVGKRKSEAISNLIKCYRPHCRCYVMLSFEPELADRLELAERLQYIVATTDTAASRRMVAKWAEQHEVTYFEAAAEGEWGSVTGVPAEFSTEAEEQPGYASVPVWVGPCLLAATMAASYVLHGGRLGDDCIRLGWEHELEKFAAVMHTDEPVLEPTNVNEPADTFGEASWCDDDLRQALRYHGMADSDENVEALHESYHVRHIADRMVETGWDVISDAIGELSVQRGEQQAPPDEQPEQHDPDTFTVD